MSEPQPPNASAEVDNDPPRGDEVVLLVEDEPAVRRLVRVMLEQAGYTVREACDGDEALTLAETGVEIDLLLTDVVMPGMNGRILAERLQARLPHLRVLFTSGYDAEELGGHGGLDDGRLLEKPYAARTLLRSVRGALDDPR